MSRSWPALWTVVAACVGPGCAGDSVPDPAERTPEPTVAVPARNLLLVTLDTTRAERVNLMGYAAAETTPDIDALLERGLVLRNHRSCSSWTLASFLCLLTGRSQVDLGVWPDNNNGGVGVAPFPHDALPSLARLLSDEGFQTSLVYANPFLSGAFNMSQGHDLEQMGRGSRDVAHRATVQLDALSTSGGRWFLHVHFNDAHSPYLAPPEYRTEAPDCPYDLNVHPQVVAMDRDWDTLSSDVQADCQARLRMVYDTSLRFGSDGVGTVIDHLHTLGLAAQTLVVFATDHGEEFGAHGFFQHGKKLYEGEIRSVAGLVYPGFIEPGDHLGPTAHEDLLPTTLELLDVAVPPEVQGSPVGSGARSATQHLVYRNELTVQAVVSGDSKLMYSWDGERALYDLSADPEELVDVYDPQDPRVAELWSLLLPQVEELEARVVDGSGPVAPGI